MSIKRARARAPLTSLGHSTCATRYTTGWRQRWPASLAASATVLTAHSAILLGWHVESLARSVAGKNLPVLTQSVDFLTRPTGCTCRISPVQICCPGWKGQSSVTSAAAMLVAARMQSVDLLTLPTGCTIQDEPRGPCNPKAGLCAESSVNGVAVTALRAATPLAVFPIRVTGFTSMGLCWMSAKKSRSLQGWASWGSNRQPHCTRRRR